MLRCPWCESDPLLQSYHDEEWGVRPCSDEKHFMFLMLECAQAGLSWMTLLRRREAYREAFANFNANTVAGWGDAQRDTLAQNPGIIRNKQKITAAIKNAGAFLQIQKEFGSFDTYLLSFSGGRPMVNDVTDDKNVPASTAVSADISLDLKTKGFAFMGPTVVYSHLQAVGIVDDHVNGCFRKAPLSPSPPASYIKLKILSRVGKALQEENILFGIGGSAMLYRNSLAEDFNDIDLVVALEDANKADAVLKSLGTRSGEQSTGVFETAVFRSYETEGVGIDMMAGLAIRNDEGVYRCEFRKDSVCDTWPVYGTKLPFCALEDWCVLYHLMPGKQSKAERIREHLQAHGVSHPDLLARILGGAPEKIARWLESESLGSKSPEEKV